MAVDFPEGEYVLTQNTSKKRLFQLKLTDSALKAFELYCELRDGKHKPTIQFYGNQGQITIPAGGSMEAQAYTFQLSSLPASSEIDCVEQVATNSSLGCANVLGAIQQKIVINANDDSYNATRQRMTDVKNQEQKSSTKEIKLKTSKLGKKKQLVKRPLLEQRHQQRLTKNITPPPHRPTTNYVQTPSSLNSSSNNGNEISAAGGGRNKTKPTMMPSLSNPSISSNVNGKPLKERVVHYLMLGTLKLPELLFKLNRGSSTPPPKTEIQAVLQQVSTSETNNRGHQEYTLHKHLFTDIQSDWSGYTDDEKNTVRRKLAEFKLKENRKRSHAEASNVSSSVSPSKNTSLHEDSYTNAHSINKRKRVARKDASQARPVSPLDAVLSTPSPVPAISSSSIVNLNTADFNLDDPDNASDKEEYDSTTHQSKSSHHRLSSGGGGKVESNQHRGEHHRDTSLVMSSTLNSSTVPRISEFDPDVSLNTTAIESTNNRHNNNERPSPTDNCDHEQENDDAYLQKYQAINFIEQRTEYRNDFYSEYQEYLNLHKKIGETSKRFAQWKEELKTVEQGSRRYKEIANTVFEEYLEVKKDENYLQDRDRFLHLHKKLKHIKHLLDDYEANRHQNKVH